MTFNSRMPEERDPKKPSFNRVAIWIVVGAIGAYMVISGIFGAMGIGS